MPTKDNEDLEAKAVDDFGGRPPLADLLIDYRRHALAKGHAHRTLITLSSDVMKLAKWMERRGLRDLSRLGPKRIQSFQSWLSRAESRAKGKPRRRLSLASRQRVLANTRSFLVWSHKAGHTLSDLSRHIDLPRLPRPLPREIPALREIATMIRVQRRKGTPMGLRNAALVTTLFACGLRRAEAVGLCVDDLDLAGREVRVKRGKGGKGRVAIIAPWAVDVVGEYLEEGRPLLEGEGSKGRVFLMTRGGAMRPNDVNELFPILCQDAKLEREVTPHALRHAFCLYLLKGGASVRVVAALAGHSLSMTARYTQLTDKDLSKVIQKAHPRGRRP